MGMFMPQVVEIESHGFCQRDGEIYHRVVIVLAEPIIIDDYDMIGVEITTLRRLLSYDKLCEHIKICDSPDCRLTQIFKDWQMLRDKPIPADMPVWDGKGKML